MTMFFEYNWSLLPSQWSYSGTAGIPVQYFTQASLPGQPAALQPQRIHRLLSDFELANGTEPRWSALELHGLVYHLSHAMCEMTHLTALFLSNNALTTLPPEINMLTSLTILDVANNQLQLVPPELGEVKTLVHLNLSCNDLRNLPYELGKLYRLKFLNVMGNPLPAQLLELAHGPTATRRVQQYLLDSLPSKTTAPPMRAWHAVKPFRAYESLVQINVLCYNVLCDRYATFNMYSYCPTWALNWDYRWKAIIYELLLYDCDILTLQEIEAEKFDSCFLPELHKHGYDGIFAAKTRVRTMTEEERRHVDGCAIFWRREKFKLRSEHLVEFGQIAVKKAGRHDAILDRVMSKDNIALIGVLETLSGVHKRTHELPRYAGFATPLSMHGSIAHMPPDGSVAGIPIVVCAAHFHWDPEYCDVKLIQTMIMMHECARQMERIADELSIPFHEVPLILGVDSNSLPDSGVVQYLLHGWIPKTHEDLKGLYKSMVLDGMCTNDYDDHRYRHSVQLESGINSEAPYATNITPEFQGMIDYIFATPQSLERLGYMGGVDPEWVDNNDIVGFPHPFVPSDHVPIMASYALRPVNSRHALPPVKRSRRRSNSFSEAATIHPTNGPNVGIVTATQAPSVAAAAATATAVTEKVKPLQQLLEEPQPLLSQSSPPPSSTTSEPPPAAAPPPPSLQSSRAEEEHPEEN